MKQTFLLTVTVGLVATVAGLVLYYGCVLGAGVACPASAYQGAGLAVLAVGLAVFVAGLVLAARAELGGAKPHEEREQALLTTEDPVPPEPEPAPTVARPVPRSPVPRAAVSAQPVVKPAAQGNLFFCPTCGKRYRTISGRYCPLDATQLKPVVT